MFKKIMNKYNAQLDNILKDKIMQIKCTLIYEKKSHISTIRHQVEKHGGKPEFTITKFEAYFPSIIELNKFKEEFPTVKVTNIQHLT